ncbi:MAG TPA: hypothetical protein DCF99_11485 [Flavobacteriaceae bacterium]|nr:hypothetical protein [Flavobacteriaceae bacterium]
MLTTKEKIKFIFKPYILSTLIFSVGFTLFFTLLKTIFLNDIDLFIVDFIVPVIFGLIYVFVYLFKFPFQNLVFDNKLNFTRLVLFCTITPLFLLQLTISKYLLNEEFIEPFMLFIFLEVFTLFSFLISLKFTKVKSNNQLYNSF